MLNEWFKFVLASVALLAIVVLGTSDIKIPHSGLAPSVIDAIVDTTITESAPADFTPVAPTEPTSAPGDSASTTLVDIPSFTELLQTVTDSVKNFIEPPAPANSIHATKGISGFKVFILTQDVLESALNEWFALQQSIVVDQLNVQDYGGGGYLVVISYHAGGIGNSSARLKLIAGENPEADANIFLSSLGASQTVRSVAAVTGSYSGSETTITVPIIFIVYE
ncbi:MAG: hypothetical protein Q8R36_05670 [bacterium]|nr:hypothetical protein [bacterium]